MTDAIHEGVTVEALQALLSEQSAFTRAFGFQVRAIEPGLCHLLVPFNPLSERPGGILSGQVYMTAADVSSPTTRSRTCGPSPAARPAPPDRSRVHGAGLPAR